MSIIKQVEPGISYCIIGNEIQSLQVIIGQSRKIIIDNTSVGWISDKFRVKLIGTLYQRIFQQAYAAEICNDSTELLTVGLNQNGYHGNIFILKSTNFPPGSSFYCVKNNFLCSTDSVDVLSKSLTIKLHQQGLVNSLPFVGVSFYYCKFHENSLYGRIFLQAGGTILEKSIENGEGIYVNLNNIVAIEDTCVVQSRPPSSTITLLPSLIVYVKGPGKVYLCSSNQKNAMSRGGLGKTQVITKIGLLIQIAITIAIISILLNKLAIEIEVFENNIPNNQQMNNNPPFFRFG